MDKNIYPQLLYIFLVAQTIYEMLALVATLPDKKPATFVYLYTFCPGTKLYMEIFPTINTAVAKSACSLKL